MNWREGVPAPKSQSSKNRCRSLCGGCLQPQKGVAPPCLTETPTTSNQPSSGNFGVKRGLGCWRGRKRFGMAGCPMKHRRSIQSSPGVLLWANDFPQSIQSSVSRKHKCLVGSVRPVVSHESEEPRRSNTPGSFLGKRSRHPQRSHLIGDGGGRLATSRPAALSVSKGAIGIPLLFLCPCDTSKWALLRMAISVCLASIRTSPCKGGGNVS